MANKRQLSEIARFEAMKTWHGEVVGLQSNLTPIMSLFPRWRKEEFEGRWCAAFVYYCCIAAGYKLPVRPRECVSCNLAGCGAWEEWAEKDPRIGWLPGACLPQPGDIAIFDRVFEDKPHDHIGIVIEARRDSILTAEGNLGNVSGVVERPRDGHIRGYVSLPDGFDYGGNPL